MTVKPEILSLIPGYARDIFSGTGSAQPHEDNWATPRKDK